MSLTGKDLKRIGFKQGKALGLALAVFEKDTSIDKKQKARHLIFHIGNL